MICARMVGVTRLTLIEDYMFGFMDLHFPSESLRSCLVFLGTVGSVVCVFVSTWILSEEKERIMMIGALAIAALTREMLGLSATIYASSFRTFVFFLFILIGMTLNIIRNILRRNETKGAPVFSLELMALLFK